VLLSHPRVHGMGERAVCHWPEPARRVARDWIRLRYRLLPYVLAEAAQAAARGLPFARPLALEPGGRRLVHLPRWVQVEHGLDTMPLYLLEGRWSRLGR
jgi:Glycosyl hydrolases family 31